MDRERNKKNSKTFKGYKIAMTRDLELVMVVLEIDEDDILSDPELRLNIIKHAVNQTRYKIDSFVNEFNDHTIYIYSDNFSDIFFFSEMDHGRKITRDNIRECFSGFNSRIRYYASAQKCRCDKAKVVDIISLRHPKVRYDEAISIWSYDNEDPMVSEFIYINGEHVDCIIDEMDDYTNPLCICSSGIHYFNDPYTAFLYAATGMGGMLNGDIALLNECLLLDFDDKINFDTIERFGDIYERENMGDGDDS